MSSNSTIGPAPDWDDWILRGQGAEIVGVHTANFYHTVKRHQIAHQIIAGQFRFYRPDCEAPPWPSPRNVRNGPPHKNLARGHFGTWAMCGGHPHPFTMTGREPLTNRLIPAPIPASTFRHGSSLSC